MHYSIKFAEFTLHFAGVFERKHISYAVLEEGYNIYQLSITYSGSILVTEYFFAPL